LVIIFSCDLPHQPGPMPTEIVATDFEPGLNVFGVLRADGVRGTSFININRALTTEEIYSDTIHNFSPEVDYVKVSSLSAGSEYQFIRVEDTSDWGNYQDTTLNVVAGETYDLEISAPGFPTLSGHTLIPNQPLLLANSLQVETDKISFEIDHHVSAYEYKLYLIFADTILDKVVKPDIGNMIPIDWTFDEELGAPMFLMLSALDENLTLFGNSPISFLPNTYHPDGSTVDGGYGCFGSVAITLINLN